jgi:hypothetical protein
MLAMERGEVDGAITSYCTLKVARQEWLRTGKINNAVWRAFSLVAKYPICARTRQERRERALLAFYVRSTAPLPGTGDARASERL